MSYGNYRRPFRYCIIENCEYFRGIPSGSKPAFFCAPRETGEPNIRQQWIDSIEAHQKFHGYGNRIKICELHFDPKAIVRSAKPTLKKGTVPTIFPERLDPSDPLASLSPKFTEEAVRPKRIVIKCKQCISTLTELTEVNAKFYRLETLLKKKQSEIREIDHDLEHTSSQLLPLRIEDSSTSNQNYIPQRTLKRKAVCPTKRDALESVGHEPNVAEESNPPNGKKLKCEPQTSFKVTMTAADAHQNGTEQPDNDDDVDCDEDLPKCERQQFSQYVMSLISDLPEQNAAQAMTVIKLFLRKWLGPAAAQLPK